MKSDSIPFNPDKIDPLKMVIERSVRFEELDPMGIMWHGRYIGWFEEGREAFGRRYGVSYLDFYKHRVMAPVKQLSVDYRRPLTHSTVYRIHTHMLWSESARMDFRYVIKDENGTVMTKASTVQLFTDMEGNLLLDHPEFYKKFLASWKNGEFI